MNLLLVEDDAEISQLLQRYLARQGFEVTHVIDGAVAIQAFATAATTKNPFDVVLTDGLLPGKTGYQVAQAIRATPAGRRVGIAMMSAAFRGNRAKTDALNSGMDAFFAKPFVLAELRDTLVSLARRHREAIGAPLPPLATAPLTTPARPVAGVGSPNGVEVDGPIAVARLLLATSRRRFDGLVCFTDGTRELKLAFLNGVVVGASENVPEHALGQWLVNQGRLTKEQLLVLEQRLRERKERVIEALLALGYVGGAEALQLVEAQARSRVRRALHVTGRVTLVDGVDAASALAVGIVDLVEVVLTVGLESQQQPLAATFVARFGREALLRTADFDSGLVAFARVRPSSVLPQKLLEQQHLTVEAAAAVDKGEVFAMWLAGLLQVPSDAAIGSKALPRAVKSSVVGGAVDENTVHRVVALLMRARGASIYRMLEMPTSSSSFDVLQRLRALNEEIGRDALATARLGPATSAARELWTIIEEGVFVFADERRRKSYDEDMTALGR
jgi:DNA-binding response OmpR family regulator